MIASTVGYDLWFVAHLIVAVSTVAVFVSMRFAATQAISSTDRSAARRRFPVRRNWAARVVHLAPLTGAVLSLSGDRDVSFNQLWVDLGLLLYVVVAFWLEAKVLPLEQRLCGAIESDGTEVAALATQFVRNLDGLLFVLTLIYVTMVVQF